MSSPDRDATSVTVHARISDLLPDLQMALREAKTNGKWNARKLQQVLAHEFDFLGPFVTARIVDVDETASTTAETLVIEFTPPAGRDLSRAEAVFAKATKRAERGDVKYARDELDRLVREFPEVAKYHRALGQAHLVEKDFERAEDELLRSLALDPRDPNALTLLGNLYTTLGSRNKAIPLYQRSASLERNVYALTNLAAALVEIGNIGAGLSTFREAVDLDSSYPNAWYGLGLTLSRSDDRNQQEEALGALDQTFTVIQERKRAPAVWDAARSLVNVVAEREAHALVPKGEAINAAVTDVEAERGGMRIRIEQASLTGILAKIELGWVHKRDIHSGAPAQLNYARREGGT